MKLPGPIATSQRVADRRASWSKGDNHCQRGNAVVSPGRPVPASRAGFTLIELLVAIAIISILAALLLPALRRGRASAHSVKCLGHLRQLALAAQMYWDDNQGACFRYGGVATNGRVTARPDSTEYHGCGRRAGIASLTAAASPHRPIADSR